MKVEISKSAKKDIRKLPKIIVTKLQLWVFSIETIGLEATRIKGGKGLHDEPLKGKRAGQRSIRLSRGYRAIYKIRKESVEFISVEEVNKHDY